jgi:hypothetical protein
MNAIAWGYVLSRSNKKKEDDSVPVKKKLTESYLGQHIDITR